MWVYCTYIWYYLLICKLMWHLIMIKITNILSFYDLNFHKVANESICMWKILLTSNMAIPTSLSGQEIEEGGRGHGCYPLIPCFSWKVGTACPLMPCFSWERRYCFLMPCCSWKRLYCSLIHYFFEKTSVLPSHALFLVITSVLPSRALFLVRTSVLTSRALFFVRRSILPSNISCFFVRT